MCYHYIILILSLYYTYMMHIRALKYPCNILRLSSQYANGWYSAAPQQSKSRNPNPAFPVQESQSRRGALPTNVNGVHFPIQHSQSRRLNPSVSIQEGCAIQEGCIPDILIISLYCPYEILKIIL